mgnify:CR=1 FL=1
MLCSSFRYAAILLCFHLPGSLATTGAVDTQVMGPGSASTVAVVPAGAAVNGVDSSLGTVNPVHQDAASDVDAARGDAVVLTEALEGRDYAALVRVVGERVAPHAGEGAYATTLVDALGARGLVRVAAHLPTGTTTTWTSLLATATTSPLWDEGRREALARDLASLVTTTGNYQDRKSVV